MGMVPKVVAMEVLETVCRRVPDENLAPSLKTILFPLQAITDPHASTPFSLDEGFKTKHDALKTRAQILMDALQKKFGTAEYTKQLLAIREELESDDVEDLVSLALGTLRAPEIEEAFANEVTQILIFLGPRLQARTRDEGPTGEALAEGDEEEAEDSRLEQRGKDLQYLFWKLSSILRQDVKSTSMGMVPKVVAMEVLETGFKTKHDALKTRAQILMDALQKKFGTAEYTKQLLAIREEVRARRQARSSKRKIEAVAHPEKYSRDKRKKTEKKKMRNKVKGQEFKAYRQAYKSW
ncbi:hypothetical protein HYQ44_015128 [Verticillium longisporum]|nr:hypothetical protein HYQ44_015128 [Verticillium longisporum]